MTAIQAFDGVIGLLAHDPPKTHGPFALAVLNAVAAAWLVREPEDELDKAAIGWATLILR